MAADFPEPAPAPGDPPAAPSDVSFGHFIVPRRPDGSLAELGRGSMGVTYRAFDTSLQMEVALKVIRADRVEEEDLRRRFRREARAAAKIRHPNIASVLYLGEQGGEFFYTMEFVPGRSLESLLAEIDGPLPPVEAVALAAQAAAALNAAHKREVVHRDLKPANLMLLEGKEIEHEDDRTDAAGRRLLKIIDFGLARNFGSNRADESMVTQTVSGFVGTPTYASPEQGNEERNLDGRSDLYSLGIILWQMLTGKLPFTGRLMEVLAKHQVQPPPMEQLAGLPAPLVELLAGLLIKDPAARRPQTANELRGMLDGLMRQLASGGAYPVSPPEPTDTTRHAPGIGTTFASRYLLDRELGVGDGGKLFRALDITADNRPVAVKVLAAGRLSSEPDFSRGTAALLDRIRQHPHPHLLAHDGGLQQAGEATFYAREWAAGLAFDEFLRLRRGGLRPEEVLKVLDTVPATLDHATDSGFIWFSLAPHKLYIGPEDAQSSGQNWPVICKQPVAQWPPFAVFINPVDFPPVRQVAEGRPALAVDPQNQHPAFADVPVAVFARLVRTLLGKAPDSRGALNNLSTEANAVLARAHDPGSFPNCLAFWTAFQSVVTQFPLVRASTPPPKPLPAKLPTLELAPRPPVRPPVVPPPTPEPTPVVKRLPPVLLAALAGAGLLAVLIIWGIAAIVRGHHDTTGPVVTDNSLPATADPAATPPPTPPPVAIRTPVVTPTPQVQSSRMLEDSDDPIHKTAAFTTPAPRKAPPPPRDPTAHQWTHPLGYVTVDLPEHYVINHPPVNPGNTVVMVALETGTDNEIDVLQVNNTSDQKAALRYIAEQWNVVDEHIHVESMTPGEDGLVYYEGSTFNFGNFRWRAVGKTVSNTVVFVVASTRSGFWQSRNQYLADLVHDNVHFP